MKNDVLLYSLILLGSTLISSISQIGLKKAAKKTYPGVIKEYLNPLVIVSYGLFFCSTLLTVLALKFVPLSLAPILESAGYVFVAVLSYFFLKESLSLKKIIGMLFILGGIVLYTFPF